MLKMFGPSLRELCLSTPIEGPMPREALDVLKRDHEKLLEDLYALNDELNGDLDAASKRLARMDDELERHFHEEEDILFPHVEGEVDELPDALEEHETVKRELKRLRGDVDFALEEGGGTMNVRGRWAIFLGAVRSHTYREDESLFPAIEDLLDREEVERIGEIEDRK